MAYDILAVSLVIGYLLDLLFGDPQWLPHPIRLFGYLISKLESKLNSGIHKKIKGTAATGLLAISTFLFFYYLEALIKHYQPSPHLFTIYVAVFVFFGLANKSLIGEGKNVIKHLNINIIKGRLRLSRIVGRETSQLTEQEVKIAVLETLSENLSDGVIAPLFYFGIAGIPGLMAYKMVNTMDSMVGYKSDRFLHYGWSAAKLDDVLNFIPARLTAFLMALISLTPRSWQFILKYGRSHASPNAGYPEAALAGILNCKFGGPNYYHGQLVHKPIIGLNNKEITAKDLTTAFRINHATTLLMITILVLLFLI